MALLRWGITFTLLSLSLIQIFISRSFSSWKMWGPVMMLKWKWSKWNFSPWSDCPPTPLWEGATSLTRTWRPCPVSWCCPHWLLTPSWLSSPAWTPSSSSTCPTCHPPTGDLGEWEWGDCLYWGATIPSTLRHSDCCLIMAALSLSLSFSSCRASLEALSLRQAWLYRSNTLLLKVKIQKRMKPWRLSVTTKHRMRTYRVDFNHSIDCWSYQFVILFNEASIRGEENQDSKDPGYAENQKNSQVDEQVWTSSILLCWGFYFQLF